jgi:hypothetical protein
MANPKDNLKERLARYRQIKISVIGRKSGRTISIPVWFVLEGEKLYRTRTCSRIRRFGLMCGAWGRNSELSRSLAPQRSNPWSRNSARSTGRRT